MLSILNVKSKLGARGTDTNVSKSPDHAVRALKTWTPFDLTCLLLGIYLQERNIATRETVSTKMFQ